MSEFLRSVEILYGPNALTQFLPEFLSRGFVECIPQNQEIQKTSLCPGTNQRLAQERGDYLEETAGRGPS